MQYSLNDYNYLKNTVYSIDTNNDNKNNDNNNKNNDNDNKNDNDYENDNDNDNDNENDDENDDYENNIYPKKRFKLILNEPCNGHKYLKSRFKCLNIKCDHKKYVNLNIWIENNPINLTKINNLNDLILLSTFYHCKMRRFFNGIDLKSLFDINEYLEELNKMIGLDNIKEEIVSLIIHLLLITYSSSRNNSDMLHSVVTGSPGCGKTTFIEIYAKILTKLGVLRYGQIIKVKRSDLIGKYLGHTAVQTQKKIDEAKGGILLIDEAYSLGNPEQRDSFSKECLDTLNQALSENKQDFICIIAGYANALDTSFFSYNEGLKRRFPFRFEIKPYTPYELGMILYKKIIEYKNWEIQFELPNLLNIIKENFKYFVNQGGDMEVLLLSSLVYMALTFLLPIDNKNKLLIDDIKESIKKFIKLKGLLSDNDKPNYLSHLYI